MHAGGAVKGVGWLAAIFLGLAALSAFMGLRDERRHPPEPDPAIAELRGQVTQLAGRIEPLARRVAALTSDVDDMRGRVDMLERRIVALERVVPRQAIRDRAEAKALRRQ